MTLLDGIIQGAIQGITEFLPVSSDGHVTLYQHLTGLSGEGSLFFTLMLHLGTLIAVFIAYYREIFELILQGINLIVDLFKGRTKNLFKGEERSTILMLVVATLPLLVFVFFKDIITNITQDNDIVVEGFCFLFTSLILFLGVKSKNNSKTAKDMSFTDAVKIGVFQGLAIMPGISRSGSTISSGLIFGYERKFVVKFAFLLGIPAILGAAIFELKDALEMGIEIHTLPLIAGVITAAVVGFACIKLLQYLVATNNFKIFAYYTFALGIVVIAAGILEHITGENIVTLVSALF